MLFSGDVLCWFDYPFLIFYKKKLHEKFNFINLCSSDKISNKDEFLQYLMLRDEIEPFVKLDASFMDSSSTEKLKNMPNCFSYLKCHGDVYSIGSIYNALPYR